MQPKTIIALTLFFFTSTLCGQYKWHIEKLGLAEGLSEGYVYAIHQDRKGFIWIGTHGGLNRYDGYGFRVFQYVPFDSTSLGDNSIFFLKEDKRTGKFWIGGSSCLNEFDPATFKNIRYRYHNEQLEFADGVFVNDHEMLLACQYDVLLFNTRTKSFSKLPILNEQEKPVSVIRVENVAEDNKGNFMVMSKTGIFFYDPITRTCRRKTSTSPDFSAFNQYQVFNVLQDRDGFYWIATNNNGLLRFQPTTSEIKAVYLPAQMNKTIPRFDVVMQDHSGKIWAGSSNGLFRIDPQTMASEFFSSDVTRETYLSHPEINALMEDRNHFMWIGTVGGGINKMIPQNSGFRNLRIAQDIGGVKTGTYTMALEEVDNKIWFMNIWDQVGNADLSTGEIRLVNKLSWYSEGSIIKNNSNVPVVLNGENSYELKQEKSGKVLVSSKPSPGLFYIHYSKNGRAFYMVKSAVEKTFCRNDTIYGNQFFYDAEEDRNGNLWIGSSKGLIQFKIKENELVHFRHDDAKTNNISSDFIYSLELDNSQENVWMAAYNGGLCSYNINSGNFRHYNKDDGLSDNIVYSLEKDDHDNLWFSTNAGISTYDPVNKIFRNYGVTDGLLNHEFNRQASCKNEKGWLFFGGIFGIDYFHPDSILKTNSLPTLAFTGIRVFNKDHIPSEKDGRPLIELKHNDSYLLVEFSALGYSNQQKIQYAYRLNDDEEWIKLGNQHSLSFSNLSIGNHELHVRSTNNEGIWLNNQIALGIVIHPPWWKKWWFRALVALLVVVACLMAIRFYYSRKLERHKMELEKQQAVEKERTRIATDIHDDLGAGLSRIKFLSETMGIKRRQDQPIEEDISKIGEYSHQMIDKMGEIVWALNEKNDSISDLLSYTRSYAVEYLSQNGIECNIELPEHLPPGFVSGEFRRNIFLSVKELLHNIVKHARANRVNIDVSINHKLSINIKDDGIGFDPARTRPYANGLVNVNKRMKDIGGWLEMSNSHGTSVRLTAPLPT